MKLKLTKLTSNQYLKNFKIGKKKMNFDYTLITNYHTFVALGLILYIYEKQGIIVKMICIYQNQNLNKY